MLFSLTYLSDVYYNPISSFLITNILKQKKYLHVSKNIITFDTSGEKKMELVLIIVIFYYQLT